MMYSEAKAAFERGEKLEVSTERPFFDGWLPVLDFDADKDGDPYYEIPGGHWYCDDSDTKTFFRIVAVPTTLPVHSNAYTCHIEYEDGGWKHSMDRQMESCSDGDLHRVTLPAGIIIRSVELCGSRLNMQVELAK